MPLRGRSRQGRAALSILCLAPPGDGLRRQGAERLSGPEIERTVVVAARQLLNDHAAISAAACNLGVGAGDIPAVLEAAGEWSRWLQSEADSAAALSGLVDKVNLKPGGIELSIHLPLPVDGTHGAAAMLPITQFFAVRMKRRGVEMRL